MCAVVNECLGMSIVWFLLALFYFRTLAFLCVRRMILLLIALLAYVPGFWLYANKIYWPLPFVPLAHMGAFMVWFALGALWGKDVLRWLATGARGAVGAWAALSVAYVLLVHLVDWDAVLPVHVPWLLKGAPYTAGVVFVMLLGAYRLAKADLARPAVRVLAYVGRNSIVFYLTHWPLVVYVFTPLGWNTYVSFLCIVLLEFPLIFAMNRYLPWCIGKKYRS